MLLIEEIFAFRLMNDREKIVYKKNLSLSDNFTPLLYILGNDEHRFRLYGLKNGMELDKKLSKYEYYRIEENEADEIKKVLEKDITKEYLKTTDYNTRYMSILKENKALKRFR